MARAFPALWTNCSNHPIRKLCRARQTTCAVACACCSRTKMQEPFYWRSELPRFSHWRRTTANIAASTRRQPRPVTAICAATRLRTLRLRPTTPRGIQLAVVCKTTISLARLRLAPIRVASLHAAPRPTCRASSYRAKPARVPVSALLTRRGSRPISTTWKPTTAPAFSSWAGFVRGTARLPACIHVERHWMCVSSVAAS